MAIGDAALAANLPLVPDSGGDDARVAHGARELNRTRDMVAETRGMIPGTKAAYRAAAGITSGTANPSGGSDGDIYFKIVA